MPENNAESLKTLFDKTKVFFENVGDSPKLKDHLAKTDQIAQFIPKNGDPFFVRIKSGRIDLGLGEKYLKDFKEGLYLIEMQECLGDIFEGEMTLGEAIFHQKIRIPGYRNKEPAIASFSKTLRLGVWGVIPGPKLFMPAK